MLHPMILYWQRVFREHSVPLQGGLAFRNSDFPDPLMSPQFVTMDLREFLLINPQIPYFNCIGDPLQLIPVAESKGYKCVKEFVVGSTVISDVPKSYDFPIEVVSLSQAIRRPIFDHLLEEAFPKDFAFLQYLLRYLPKTNAKYYTLFMKKGDEITSMITTGINRDIGLVLNAAVDQKYRGQGLSRHLINAVIQLMKSKKVQQGYFWTDLKSISKYGEQLDSYLIFAKD